VTLGRQRALASAVVRITTPEGVSLAAYDFGGDGPPLLLAHATGFHARTWLPVVAAGLSERFHCYAFDERAHGDSSPPPSGDFSWHRFADDALAVIDALGLGDGPVFGVGHSCGGALLLLAEMARPGTLRSLYCYEPVVMPLERVPSADEIDPSQNPLAIGARRRREVFDSLDAALANYSSKPPFAGLAPESLRAYVEYGFEPFEGGVRLKCRGEDEARTYENAIFHGAYLRLGEVHCPVTLACGEHTSAFGEDVLRLSAARLPAARVEVLPGLTHFGPLEDPAAVAAGILRAFDSAS
jgi:pimeloyl-ACP methyl ester carboxylesterase